ncbi:MAG: hypothetical protein Fur009_7880 [Candidatus Microgenomates bacterium]
MHPDERNMADALSQLTCQTNNLNWQNLDLKNCFNPHFFAYGQLPLYLGYLLIFIFKLINHQVNFFDFGKFSISFDEATIALRIISAFSSVVLGIIVIKIIKIINEKIDWATVFLIIFSPFAIAYSHFGTTEALLMLFYTYLLYLGLIFLDNQISDFFYILKSGFILGLALSTKISSLIFFGLVIFIIFFKKVNFKRSMPLIYMFVIKAVDLIFLIFITSLIFLIFSFQNLVSWPEFLSSLDYESGVGLGKYVVFYTQQFVESVPVIFQIIKIIPYALGGIGVIGLISLIGLISQIRKKEWVLIAAFLIYFLPNGFVFAKWTRFIAPVFPILLILGIMLFERIKIIRVIKVIIIILLIIPGIFYLKIYLQSDIRFQASKWIFENIPENSYILSETANVIDLPLRYNNYNGYKSYKYISFDFYNLDKSPSLQEQLKKHLLQADYIIVPSRRIFANYTCLWPEGKNTLDKLVYKKNRCQNLKKDYPLVNDYYEKLFSGKLGFKLIKKFTVSNIIDDEKAEETWSVFDHPVIRVYERVKKLKS